MRTAVILLIALLGIYAAARIGANLSERPTVPAACQLLGGTWGPWSGWRCY